MSRNQTFILFNYTTMSYPTYSDLELEIQELEEENKTLKDKIEFLTQCLDDRDKSIAIMQEENRKLKEERDKYYAEWHLRHS